MHRALHVSTGSAWLLAMVKEYFAVFQGYTPLLSIHSNPVSV